MDYWFIINDNSIDLRTDSKFIAALDAAELTVKKIIDTYPAPYRLMVSGGVDSQAMLYAWKLFGKEYIPTSITYNGTLNRHDLITLHEFSKKENIKIDYIDFDLLDFYQTNFLTIVEKYKCTSPQFAAHLGMTESLNGTCIFSGDRLLPNLAVISSANLCIVRASKIRSIVPYFFMHTPELAYSSLFEKYSVKRQTDVTKYFYEEKVNSYLKSGFPIIAQEIKYTGFEKVKEYFDTHYSHLLTPKIKLKYASKASQRTYDLLLRYPYEDKFGVIPYKYILNEL